MAGPKLYTGIALEDETLKIARIKVSGKKASLISLDSVTLIESLDKPAAAEAVAGEDVFGGFDDEAGEGVFGLEDDDDDDFDLSDVLNEVEDEEEEEDLDLDFDLDLDAEGDSDMAAETEEGAASNEILLYNLFSSLDPKKLNIGVNIPSGTAIYQILKDVDFSDTKKKDIQVIVEDRLESIYGSPKASDLYSYTIRDDGALLLCSIDDSPDTIRLADSALNLYKGKLTIDEVMPDEMLIVGLIRSNYELEGDTITAAIQYSGTQCRVLFLRGDKLWIVSPIITEGTRSQKFLSKVFSKILFQLDTGEVPNLDRIILCNNSLGQEAVDFFQDRFPDIDISEFTFNEDVFDIDEYDPPTVANFTTAIGMAWAAAGFKKESFPDISFLPDFIRDRQKIFKLQWHGFLLLFLILMVFPITNYFYLSNSVEIDRLRSDISTRKSEITALEPTVNEYNRISAELTTIQSRLELLDELSSGTLTWSVNLDILNQGIDDINSIWLTFMSQDERTNVVVLQGYSLYRNRIPMVADLFSDAVLIDVTRTTIRDKEVFSFEYQVRDFVSDKEMYTPESAKGLREVLDQ